MRFSIRSLTLLLLCVTASPSIGRAQKLAQLQPADRVRLAEAKQLCNQVCERLWPGWGNTAFQILLVGDSAEFLAGSRRDPEGFTSLGYDSVLGSVVWTRPRRFPPTLLATFPAVGGIPTIVVGSAERTGKSSTAWVLTLLHEHFHQRQYSQPDYYAGVRRLDLARGDTTGQWMLDYPFPYDSAPVQQAMRALAQSLARALESRPQLRRSALQSAQNDRNALRRLLPPADYRYFEFQLWQEGTARFIEYAGARAAGARKPAPGFRSLPDYQPYGQAADSALSHVRHELAQLDLARDRRVTFYPVGAAWAVLLDQSRPGWKQAYTRHPFTLPDLVPARW
jgi:hypothetical protein